MNRVRETVISAFENFFFLYKIKRPVSTISTIFAAVCCISVCMTILILMGTSTKIRDEHTRHNYTTGTSTRKTTRKLKDIVSIASTVKTKNIEYKVKPNEEKNRTTLNSTLEYLKMGVDYIRNMPPAIFINDESKGGYLNKSNCARFPRVYNLKFSSTIWQVQEQSNWTFYFFGAYWDVRDVATRGPSIRILAMMDRKDENISTNYCQLWFERKKEPLITKISEYTYVWRKVWANYRDGELQPYLLNCQLPKDYKGPVPVSVSVVPSQCTSATNNIRVHFDKPAKKQMFAVCVKGLDFLHSNWSFRIVEWIETLGILGVDKIFFYELAVHRDMKKVLKYYQDRNKIQVLPLTVPGGLPNEPHIRHVYLMNEITKRRQHELIPYNDCLYRNMYKYQYIALLDIDEVIIPHSRDTWPELVKLLVVNDTEKYKPYFVFDSLYFDYNDVRNIPDKATPDYLHMLRHTTRLAGVLHNQGIKCFHRPEGILTLHNHFPTNCFKKCEYKVVDHKNGFVHHYRSDKPYGLPANMTYIVDKRLRKWKDELILRSNKVLIELGLIVEKK